MKYIIKNCPSCYYIYCDKEYECNWRGSGIIKPCQDCTDCVLKQIVDNCKHYFNYDKSMNFLAQIILDKLDIQEVE